MPTLKCKFNTSELQLYGKPDLTPNSLWKHKKSGTLYKLVMVANQEADPKKRKEFPLTIIYEGLQFKKVWSCTEESFLNRMEPTDAK